MSEQATSNFWQEAADAPVIEGGGGGIELPQKVWFSGFTTTAENGGAGPRISEVAFDDGTSADKMKVCVMADGAEPGHQDEKYIGRFCFGEMWVQPNPSGDDKDNIVSGRLTGFLNAVFSPGVATGEKDSKVASKLRWANTMKELQEVAERESITLDAFGGNRARYVAGVAVAALQAKPYRLLFKTMGRKDKKDPKKVYLQIGDFEDCTEANLTKRKVKSLDQAGSSEGPSF